MEETQQYINQPGVYATFRADDFDEEDRKVDRSYWGGLIEDEEDDQEIEGEGEEG
eukprot:CAMPEP_0204821624 /NCGR_PEP_ID=MMETSP1018-20131115/38251_1 /ASSEMBLY_ACC=CAM_ASM_000518 /TAXON_ID=46462 /ORGANISM="Anophryoides haemophila, Strain AH6" /LENGTH=54 /DNA_ID=CAMNT_0051938327 /DNA_START=764 /DNA_END=928 /DNA_ORIENTATION=+